MAEEQQNVQEEQQDAIVGFVHQSLQRNNKQIRQDRAEALAEDLETPARRACEDLWSDLRKLKRDRQAMYDFSPSNTQSLVLAKEVDGRSVWKEDMELSKKIFNTEIEFKIACERYLELYGKNFKPAV